MAAVVGYVKGNALRAKQEGDAVCRSQECLRFVEMWCEASISGDALTLGARTGKCPTRSFASHYCVGDMCTEQVSAPE